VLIQGCRITDDQGSPTQTHGIHWSGATRGRIKDNDLRGNLTGPVLQAFDTKTIYEGNVEVDDLYEGTATLVAGTVTVSTAAVNSTGSSRPASTILLNTAAAGGTPGALFVNSVNDKTNFVIKSTSGTDTSVVKWRLR
jgi:hypothetical protein